MEGSGDTEARSLPLSLLPWTCNTREENKLSHIAPYWMSRYYFGTKLWCIYERNSLFMGTDISLKWNPQAFGKCLTQI